MALDQGWERTGGRGPSAPQLGVYTWSLVPSTVAAAAPCRRLLGSFGQQRLLACHSSEAHRDSSHSPWGPPAQPAPLPPAPPPNDPSHSVTTSESQGSLWTLSGYTEKTALCPGHGPSHQVLPVTITQRLLSSPVLTHRPLQDGGCVLCSEGPQADGSCISPFSEQSVGLASRPSSSCRAEKSVTRDAGCSGLRLRKCR